MWEPITTMNGLRVHSLYSLGFHLSFSSDSILVCFFFILCLVWSSTFPFLRTSAGSCVGKKVLDCIMLEPVFRRLEDTSWPELQNSGIWIYLVLLLWICSIQRINAGSWSKAKNQQMHRSKRPVIKCYQQNNKCIGSSLWIDCHLCYVRIASIFTHEASFYCVRSLVDQDQYFVLLES